MKASTENGVSIATIGLTLATLILLFGEKPLRIAPIADQISTNNAPIRFTLTVFNASVEDVAFVAASNDSRIQLATFEPTGKREVAVTVSVEPANTNARSRLIIFATRDKTTVRQSFNITRI